MTPFMIPLLWQLFGPAPLSQSYLAGQQWTAPFGAYTATTKTLYVEPTTRFQWARFLVIWKPKSCLSKVRLLARDAAGVVPDLELLRIEACGVNAGSATAARLHLPDWSGGDITHALNTAIQQFHGFAYLLYQMQDDGLHPIGWWEVRIEAWMMNP